MRRARILALGLIATGYVAGAIACSSANDTALANSPGQDGGGFDSPSFDSGFGDSGIPVANGLVLVHAAAFPAFRICFERLPDAQPLPDKDLMPSSNVPGVEVGNAVRVLPPSLSLGRAFVFREATIRPSYPPGGGTGPSCGMLLGGAIGSQAITVGDLGTVTEGITLLVLTGCLGTADDPAASATRCGSTWTSSKGNLALAAIPIQAGARGDLAELPLQAIQLSPAIDALGRTVSLSYGSRDGGGPMIVADDLRLDVPSKPMSVTFAPDEISSYGNDEFTVSLGARRAGAGPTDAGSEAGVLLSQSLADIQRLSAPGADIQAFYGAGSSYTLLVVGEPDPRLGDGGSDDDTRRRAHIIALPLARPPAQ